MAFDIGSLTQFDDSNLIADPVLVTIAKAVQPPRYQGGFWGSLGAPMTAINAANFEVYNRTHTDRDTTVGVATWADGVDTTALDVTSSDGMTIGTVLKIESELVVVSAVNSSTSIDVVARGAGGTTGASHAAGVAIEIVGSAINDADLKNVTAMSEQTGVYMNYAQTVAEAVEYQKLYQTYIKKGMSGEQATMMLRTEAMYRMAKTLERACIYGTKAAGSASVPTMTAGLFEQLEDTASGLRPAGRMVTDVSGAFTEAVLTTALENAYKYGNPDAIWMNQANKNLFNAFTSDFQTVTVNAEVGRRQAGSYVDEYIWEGNIIRVAVDNHMPNDKVAIVSSDKCWKAWVPNDALRIEEEPKTSSREFRETIQGTFGIGIEDVGHAHSLLKGLTT